MCVDFNLKCVTPQEHNINLDAGEQCSEAFLKLNPMGAIPALVDHGPGRSTTPLTQSLAILEFVDESFPTPVAPRHTRMHDGVARPCDGVSSLQVLVALSALVAAIKECAAPQPSWPLALALLVMSAGAAALFIRRQSRLAYPLLDFSLFRNPAFTAGVLAAAFVTLATRAACY